MTKTLAIATALLAATAASGEMAPPPQLPAATKPPLVRNIGIAERGDAIVVRERKVVPSPMKAGLSQ